MTIPQQLNEIPNLLEAYRIDPMVREKCQEKGIYANFNEGSVVLTMYLTDQIEDSSYYHEFSELCAPLTPDDTIVLFIDSPGGYLSGAQLITRTIANCPAYCVGIVTDMAASAATIISLACDELRMEPFSYFMIHSVSFGSGGKLHEVQASTEFTIKQSKAFIEATYKDFLTAEEIVDVIRGTDLYLTADEVTERFERIQERRMKTHLEYEQEHIKEHIEGLKNQLKQLEARVKPEEKPKPKPKQKKVS